jgi:MoaA/NifB/PqqE/SkfB family radical SAM enzyme
MKPAPFNLLLDTASKDNILVLTSDCSTSCIFCSHLQNPAEVDAYYAGKLSREQIDILIEFLAAEKKIVIGESATRICEGEPFIREDIIDILQSIRLKHCHTPIQITTSGVHLDEAVLAELKRIGGIELNISLNSSSARGREKLYRGKSHMGAVAAVRRLKHYGISYSGSIVAMPHLVGWEDIRETVLFLNDNGASAIRIFMPGYTRFTKGVLPPGDIRSRLQEFASDLERSVEAPLIIEPPGIKDTHAEVLGVLRGSPAWNAGIVKGDRILRINGREAVSRVDAYYRILKAGCPELEVMRKGECRCIIVNKQPKTSSGMVFNYDIDPDTVNRIKKRMLGNRGSRCLLLTSELAYDLLTGCIAQNDSMTIEAVKNRYFGGNIMCAGLLTISDIEAHMSERAQLPQVLLLPEIMFDTAGRDLLGRHFKEVEEGLGIKVELV